jgi:hypothetical protein
MIEAGATYQTPFYARKIMVLAIDKEDDKSYTLDILWVEPDTNLTVPDSLVVSKEDAAKFQKVSF